MENSPRSQIITVSVMAGILFLGIFYYFAQQIIKVQHWLQDIDRPHSLQSVNRIKELPPLTMPEVIHGPEAEEMVQMYLKASSLVDFYRIPDSSTLYLVFHNFNQKEETDYQSASSLIKSTTNHFETVALLDLKDPSHSVFTTLFRTQIGPDYDDSTGEYSNSRRHEIRTYNACLLNGIPSAIFYRTDDFPPHGVLADPNRDTISSLSLYGSYLALDADGFHEIKRHSRTLEYFQSMQAGPFLFDRNYPFRLMEIDNWITKERITIPHPVKQSSYWQKGRLTSLEFQAIRKDLFFGSNPKHTKIAFFTTQSQPVFREFEAKELFGLLPIQPEDLTLEYYRSIYPARPSILPVTFNSVNFPERRRFTDQAQFQWQYWHKEPLRLQPLSRGNDSSLLVQLIMPNNPILRIHIDKIPTGTFSEIVEFIGNCDTHTAQKAFDNDRVIVFHPNPFEGKIHSEPEQSAYTYFIARLQENGRLSPMETVAGSLPLDPTEFIHISPLPYDDEHFLIAGNNAFYTLRWDGAESKKVFPR